MINPLANYGQIGGTWVCLHFLSLKNNPIYWSGCSGLLLRKACPRETPQALRLLEESDCLERKISPKNNS
jgi:hypothetical protein